MVQFPREIFVIRLYLINYVHVVDLSPTPWEQRAGLVPGMGVGERGRKLTGEIEPLIIVRVLLGEYQL